MKISLGIPSFSFLCAASALSLGCVSTPWTIVRQTDPDPFISQRDWVVEPLRYDNLVIDGEPAQQYLGERDQARMMGDPRFQRDVRIDLAKMSDAFVWRLTQNQGPIHVAPSNGPGAFTIRASVHGVSTGLPRGNPSFGASVAPAQAFLSLTLLDPEGRELDVVDMQTEVDPDALPMNDAERIPECGVRIGELALAYLGTRVDTLVR